MADVVALRAPDESSADNASDALFLRMKRWYGVDWEKARIWREQALEDFRFRDGDQWTPEELELLREQMRPTVTFNRVGVLVDAVVGSEIGNRREVRFIPREQNDAKPNEVLTSAAEWFRDQCDAEDEESESFKDNVTAGMGWTETRLDFSDNPEGAPLIERVDPFEMVWDANATKANLVDAKRIWRVRRVSAEDARELHPGYELEELNAAWADTGEDEDKPDVIDRRNRYGDTRHGLDRDDLREVTLCVVQYVETETFYKTAILDEMGQPQVVELSEAKFAMAEKAGKVLQSARMTRKVVMQCWLGASGVIGESEATQTGAFTYNCITGLKDADKGIFYGVVRRVKDPQRWFNKWLSQNMHILNSQAKGGIMAERGAFEDVREAERTWTRPEAITLLKDGALSNPNAPKVQPKPAAQLSAGVASLMQMADEFIVKCSGINMELLGMRDANQPGVLEYQRRQSGITILATFFDSLRRYRKIQGRCLLKLIQDYLSDGRLIRIVGDERSSYVPLTKEAVSSAEYDIIVDDSPSSPNEKEKTWQLVQGFLPMIKDMVGPKEGLMLAEYSPLPASLVEKLKAIAAQAEQGQGQPSPQEQQAMELQQAQFQLEQMKLQNEAEKIMADREKAASDREIALINAETERMRIQADNVRAIADANRPQPAPNSAR